MRYTNCVLGELTEAAQVRSPCKDVGDSRPTCLSRESDEALGQPCKVFSIAGQPYSILDAKMSRLGTYATFKRTSQQNGSFRDGIRYPETYLAYLAPQGSHNHLFHRTDKQHQQDDEVILLHLDRYHHPRLHHNDPSAGSEHDICTCLRLLACSIIIDITLIPIRSPFPMRHQIPLLADSIATTSHACQDHRATRAAKLRDVMDFARRRRASVWMVMVLPTMIRH